MRSALGIALLTGLLACPHARAEDGQAAPTWNHVHPYEAALAAKLHPKSGDVSLAGIATLTLPPTAAIGYLSPDETVAFVSQMRQIRLPKTLGSLIPLDVPFDMPNGWIATITYRADGHVNDADAARIDGAALLTQMQKDATERNIKLKSLGYTQFIFTHLNWAEKPQYDSAHHVLSWTTEAGGKSAKDRRIASRLAILGKDGVLLITLTGSIEQLPLFEALLPKVAAFTRFSPGREYSAYRAGDKAAPYGLTDLITDRATAKAPATR